MTFHELYEKYAADVYSLALALSGSRVEAEDVTSETFMRAFAGFDTLRMPTVKAYLLTVARNQVFMRFRRRRKCFYPHAGNPLLLPQAGTLSEFSLACDAFEG